VAGRHRDLDRLLTFVDAVVAIAITVLVLPLTAVAGELHDGTTADLLRAHSDDLLGFALSFWVIAQLWLGQHRILSGLVRQNNAVIQLLLIWTFTIVFLPFPTSLVAASKDNPVAKILYIGTMAISSLTLALVAWVIRRDRSIRDTEEGPDPWPLAGITVSFVLALAISLAFPETSYWPLLILFLNDPVTRLVRRATVAMRRRMAR
jgi:uncharacterized membrane protein